MKNEFVIGKVKFSSYLALLFLILFFSGLLSKYDILKAFDFASLSGSFGLIKINELSFSFIGKGGDGARAGFLFAFSLIPAIMLALGVIELMQHYGAIKAAQKLLSPILKPILGVAGLCGIILITDLQSTDAGAIMSKQAYEDKLIDEKSLIIIAAWQYSGAGLINNFFAIGAALILHLSILPIIIIILMIIMKFIGAIFVRIVLNTIYKKDFV